MAETDGTGDGVRDDDPLTRDGDAGCPDVEDAGRGATNAVPAVAVISGKTAAVADAVFAEAIGAKPDAAQKIRAAASPALLAALVDMPESATGLGVRARDGTIFAVAFMWDNHGRGPVLLYLKYTRRVEGPSLRGTAEISEEFCVYAFDQNPLRTIEENVQNSNTFKCQRALANNPALAGKLKVGSSHEMGIRIVYTGKDGREFVFFLTGVETVSIFERKSRANVKNVFNPSSVTQEDLDYAIARLSTAPNIVPVVAEAQAE